MDITAIFKAVLTPDKDRSTENYAPFKPGDKVVGTVLRLEADGRALIDLGRFRALAQTSIPVQVGQKLPLKVIQAGAPTHLQLETKSLKSELPLPRMALSTLITNDEIGQVLKSIDRLLTTKMDGLSFTGTTSETISSPVATKSGDSGMVPVNMANGHWPESVQHALRLLRDTVAPLSSHASIDQQAKWVQSAVEDRGILFELKLADVLQKAAPHESIDPKAPLPETMIDKGYLNSGAVKTGAPLESSDMRNVVFKNEANTISGREGRLDSGKDSFVPTSIETTPLPSIQTTSQGATDVSHFQHKVTTQGIDPNLDSIQKALDGSLEKSEAALKALGATVTAQNQSSTAPVSDTLSPTVLESVRQILAGDLKPQLLILKRFLDQVSHHPDVSKEVDAKDLSILRQVVHQMLSHVEQQQDQAVRRTVEPDLYQVFTHLLPIKDQEAPVRLKIYYPQKGRAAENDSQHRIALLLDMDQLGLVRADLHMVEQQLRIQFFVQDDIVQQMFVQHGHTVAEVLEGEGYFETVVIDTRVSMEKIQQFEGEDLAGPPLGRINVTV